MNDKQKFLAIGAGALLVGVILGFVFNSFNKPEPAPSAQQQQQETNSSQLPEGHPTVPNGGNQAAPAPAQPINMDNLIGRIDAFLQESYPGDWKAEGTKLYKGDYLENDNFKIVDELETKIGSGAMISIFVGETRISTNIKQQGAGRAIDYPVPEQVAEVMKTGKEIDGGSSSMGDISFSKVYLPLKDKDGKTIGVMSVSVSQ